MYSPLVVCSMNKWLNPTLFAVCVCLGIVDIVAYILSRAMRTSSYCLRGVTPKETSKTL